MTPEQYMVIAIGLICAGLVGVAFGLRKDPPRPITSDHYAPVIDMLMQAVKSCVGCNESLEARIKKLETPIMQPYPHFSLTPAEHAEVEQRVTKMMEEMDWLEKMNRVERGRKVVPLAKKTDTDLI